MLSVIVVSCFVLIDYIIKVYIHIHVKDWKLCCICAYIQNYFEELVSVRDTQLARTQTELATYTEENERQKKDLEAIVLELQGQM